MSGPFPIIAAAPNLGGAYPTGVPVAPGGARDATPGGGGGEPSSYLGTLLPAPPAPLADRTPEDQLGSFDSAQQAAAEKAAAEALERQAGQEAQEAREAKEQAERERAQERAEAEQREKNTPPVAQPPVVVTEHPQPVTGGGPQPPVIIGEHPQPGTRG